MSYFNIELGIGLGHYILEVSLLSRNWELCSGNIHDGIIRHFSFGPLHVSWTDRKKLNELATKESPVRITLEEIIDL